MYIALFFSNLDILKWRVNCRNAIAVIKYILKSFVLFAGNTVSHIRDCSDNNWFSFNSSISNDRGAYDRLFQLTLNNETACVWDGQHLVCLSKCDTDFCNGPVLKEKQVVNSGNFSNIGNFNQRSLLVLASIVYTYLYSRSTVIVWLSRHSTHISLFFI